MSFALIIINPKVIPWQLLKPMDLPRMKAFRVHEALKVVIVCKHKNFMLATF